MLRRLIEALDWVIPEVSVSPMSLEINRTIAQDAIVDVHLKDRLLTTPARRRIGLLYLP